MQDLEFFLGLCNKLCDKIKEILYFSDCGIRDDLNISHGKRSVLQKASFPDRIIRLQAPASCTAYAVPKTAVFLEPADIDLSIDIFEAGDDLPGVSVGSVFGLADLEGFFITGAHGGFVRVEIAHAEDVVDGSLSHDELESKIRAAAARGLYGYSVSTTLERSLENELVLLDSLLAQHGGTTFNSLVSRTMGTSTYGSANVKDMQVIADKGLSLTKEHQYSIFKSIIVSDKVETFTDQMEEQYKDIYFKKESLGRLYNVVKRMMSLDKAATMTKQKANITFKDMIVLGKDPAENRTLSSLNDTFSKTAVMNTVFEPYTITVDKGLVKTNSSSQNKDSTGVIVYKPNKDLPKGCYLVNNVVITHVAPKNSLRVSGGSSPAGPRSGSGTGNTPRVRTRGSY